MTCKHVWPKQTPEHPTPCPMCEEDALRAEVAALREVRDDLTTQMEFQQERAENAERERRELDGGLTVVAGRLLRAEHDLATARELLARWERYGNAEGKAFADDVRAFLDPRRDEARRCTCGVDRYTIKGEWLGHGDYCPKRDEARGAPECTCPRGIREIDQTHLLNCPARAAPTEPADE